jgi:hypothetical protein
LLWPDVGDPIHKNQRKVIDPTITPSCMMYRVGLGGIQPPIQHIFIVLEGQYNTLIGENQVLAERSNANDKASIGSDQISFIVATRRHERKEKEE